MFRYISDVAQNIAASRFLLSVFEPLVSKPLRSVKFLITPFNSLKTEPLELEFKIVRAIQKSCRTERPEDLRLQDRERVPRSGKISSLSQWLLKHSQRAIAGS
ncbi:hypothetical protein [Rahnella aceris]|uniref:hypothetical protein n=1 Tax=Rahnella sp. (strain Y9602) TaxID=2703885 RepID=UPI001C277FCD|nr:hypothetical protein [Rahnella aceris]MBU9851536.1 hypothetical protein [Rahnella aceris]